jgi:hypothetical protein
MVYLIKQRQPGQQGRVAARTVIAAVAREEAADFIAASTLATFAITVLAAALPLLPLHL